MINILQFRSLLRCCVANFVLIVTIGTGALSNSYVLQSIPDQRRKERRPQNSGKGIVSNEVARLLTQAVNWAIQVNERYFSKTSCEGFYCDSPIPPPYELRDSVAVTEGLRGIRRENLKEYHRFLSEKPHRSGSERDGVDIVDFLENSLRKSGFDEVKKVPYLLVHPQPDPEHPNSVRLIHDNGTVLLEAKMTEDRIPGIDTDIGPAYLAFSAQGTVESQYVGGSAMQRGTLDFTQDAETPGYPSIPMRIMNPPGLPKIPAQVIGYDDARVLLKQLGGQDWAVEGGFNFTYKTGPFSPKHTGMKVRLSVNNMIKRLVVHDVIGVIRGSVEPDQFSVTGNHHDAWGFGASDPSSGTAALLEASRTLGDMVRRGWRPRRSIVVAFWAQEEFGMAGSREWVEFPVVEKTCGHATNDCQGVDISSYIDLSGAGSDNIAFNIFAGVPSVDFYFTPDPKVDGVSSAPSYHTAYETLDLYQRFMDPDYAIMERCSQLVGALTLSLAETELLPYNMADLGHALLEGFGDLQTHMEDFQMHNVSAGWLEKEIDLFVQTADVWHKWICDRKSFDAGTLRIINKRMMLVERAFIKPDGLMGNPTIRNLAFGVSIENSYRTVAFSVLRLQLYQVSRMKPGSGEATQAWLDIRRSVNDIALAIRSARMMLDPDRIV
ncbi:hypothetical protein HPB47_012867 [Ixodes persulcatus]|uniref:Uncharacterized protein n=1 Tax=Ixodes persulcatus TaxID=34615 RepID=A0AC60NS97_IXOPE|nr:hypothetical protein HPB47_012867 [Ixodes persulcatus]